MHAELRVGDVLWSDATGELVIVARVEFGEVMLVDLPRRDADGALRVAVETLATPSATCAGRRW